MKPAGWQKEYKGIFEFAKISFALSFVVLRICYWPYMSYPFWVSSLELLQVNLTLNVSILLTYYFMWSGALDSSHALLSYSITSLA